jgi:hypothetical protein
MLKFLGGFLFKSQYFLRLKQPAIITIIEWFLPFLIILTIDIRESYLIIIFLLAIGVLLFASCFYQWQCAINPANNFIADQATKLTKQIGLAYTHCALKKVPFGHLLCLYIWPLLVLQPF